MKVEKGQTWSYYKGQPVTIREVNLLLKVAYFTTTNRIMPYMSLNENGDPESEGWVMVSA